MPTVARPVGSMILLAAAAALMSADDVLGASADTDG
jgi:hypothetical protein